MSTTGGVRGFFRARPVFSRAHLVAMLLPLAALIALGLVVPLGRAAQESLSGPGGPWSTYEAILTDKVFLTILARTFITAAGVTAICMVVSYPTAVAIASRRRRTQAILLALVVIPLWTSVVARSYAWVGIFQNGGFLDQVTGVFGLPDINLMYSTPGVILAMVHVMLPFSLLPMYSAVRGFDQRYELASRSMGASSLATLWKVKLPILAPQIVTTGIVIFVLSLAFYVTPAVIGGPTSSMISNLIRQQVYDRLDFARGSGYGIVLLVSTLLLLAVGLLGRTIASRRAGR